METGIETQVNINEASLEELVAVNKLGPVLAEKIIANRPYDSLDDLTHVDGIGSKLLDLLRPHLTVEAAAEIESEKAPEEGEFPLIHRAEADIIQIADLEEKEGEAEEEIEPEPLEPAEEEEEKLSAAAPHQPLPADELEESEPAEVALPETEEEPMVAVGEDSESIFYPSREDHEKPEEVKPQKETPVRTLQVVEEEKEKPAKPKAAEKQGIRKGEMLAWVTGGSLLALILAVLISLGILGIINKSLRYRTEILAQGEYAALQDRLDQVDSELESMTEDITGLRTRLDAIEPLSGRVSTLETETNELQDSLAETTESLNSVVEELTGINEEIELLNQEMQEVKESASVFESFLQQLKSLLNDLVPSETEGKM